MPLFGRRKRPPTDTSPYEAAPIELGGAARLDGGEPKLGSPHGRGGAARLDGGESKLPAGDTGLTPADVRNAKFGKPRIGRRGYNVDEVDALLDLVESELDRPASQAGGGLTPADVDTAVFSAPPIGRRGYNEDEVDAFLDRIAAELRHRAASGE